MPDNEFSKSEENANKPITEEERLEALKPQWTPEFLELLAETARTIGWNCDHIATMDFVNAVFDNAGVKCPELDAYDVEYYD